jgi:tubulin polyglutamylase TTLL6/13
MNGNGSKRHLEWFKKYLNDNHYNSDELFEEIDSIIVKSLICAQPSLSHYYKSCQPNDIGANMCFEILGFDIFIDHKLKP